MSQSIKLLLLQIFSIIMGLFSVFYVAGNIPPKFYALVGVYEVIAGLIRVFSSTGIETLALRNILVLQEENNKNKITEIVTLSIVTRVALAIALILPLLVYVTYMSNYKFDGMYLGLFTLMLISGMFIALNESLILILKSFNNYVSAGVVHVSVNVLGKLVALWIFHRMGFELYISFVIILPALVSLIMLLRLREYICIRTHYGWLKIKEILKETRPFALSAYISYVYNLLDQLIVSLIFPPEILSSFTLAKRILAILRNVVSNIFDPLIQSLVKYKFSHDILMDKIHQILDLNKRIFVVSLGALLTAGLFVEKVVIFLRLQSYPNLSVYIITVLIGVLVLIHFKARHQIMLIFFRPRYNLQMSLVLALSSIIFFILLSSISTDLSLVYVPCSYLVLYLFGIRSVKPYGSLGNAIKKQIGLNI